MVGSSCDQPPALLFKNHLTDCKLTSGVLKRFLMTIKTLLLPLSLRKFQWFQKLCARNRRKTKNIFFIINHTIMPSLEDFLYVWRAKRILFNNISSPLPRHPKPMTEWCENNKSPVPFFICNLCSSGKEHFPSAFLPSQVLLALESLAQDLLLGESDLRCGKRAFWAQEMASTKAI